MICSVRFIELPHFNNWHAANWVSGATLLNQTSTWSHIEFMRKCGYDAVIEPSAFLLNCRHVSIISLTSIKTVLFHMQLIVLKSHLNRLVYILRFKGAFALVIGLQKISLWDNVLPRKALFKCEFLRWWLLHWSLFCSLMQLPITTEWNRQRYYTNDSEWEFLIESLLEFKFYDVWNPSVNFRLQKWYIALSQCTRKYSWVDW